MGRNSRARDQLPIDKWVHQVRLPMLHRQADLTGSPRILLGNSDCVFLRLHSIVNLPRRSSLSLHSAVSEPESRHFSRCRTAHVAAAPCPYPASGAASRNIAPCIVSTIIVSTEGFLQRVSLSATSRHRLLPSCLVNTLGIGTVNYFVPALLRLSTRWSASQ